MYKASTAIAPAHGAHRMAPAGGLPRAARVSSSPLDTAMRWFLYFAWFHTTLDPHRWVGIGQSESIVVMGVLGIAVLQAMRKLDRPWKFFLAVLSFLGACILGIVNAPLTGLVTEFWTLLFQFWVLGVATMLTFTDLRHVATLLFILFLQFPWWVMHGALQGQILWHPLLGDENAFASVMVMGMAIGFHFSRGMRKKWLKRLMQVTAALCIFGLVASMARGAVIAAAAVAFLTWLRSPSKGRTTVGILVGGLVLSVASEVMKPDGGFWTEMATIFDEGGEGSTGEDRMVVWGAAMTVWAQHPIVGVGLQNYGPYASTHFQYGDLEGMYADPRTLLLKAVHNDPIQLLAETGLIGFGIYCYIIYLFFKKAQRLRRIDFRRAWARIGPRDYDILHVSYGLEGAMVAILVSGMFYPQLDRIWFWGLLVYLWLIYHQLEDTVKRDRRSARTVPPRQAAVLR